MEKRFVFWGMLFLVLAVLPCRGQGLFGGYMMPDFREMHGEGVRKIVSVSTYPSDNYKRRVVWKIAKDGTVTYIPPEPVSRKHVKQYRDKATGEVVCTYEVIRYMPRKHSKDDTRRKRVRVPVEQRVSHDTLAGVCFVTRTTSSEEGKCRMVSEEHHNIRTFTDSCFSGLCNEEIGLEYVKWYSDSTFSTLVKYRYCREGVQHTTTTYFQQGDTMMYVTVWDTDKYRPKPYFLTHKKYAHLEEDCYFSPDSLLLESRRIVRNGRGLPDTIYYYRRYGPYTGCMGRRDTNEYHTVTTFQYEYNDRGGVVEEREYKDGELMQKTHYKLRYRRKTMRK